MINKFSAYSTSALAGIILKYKYDDRQSAELIMEAMETNFDEIQRELLDRGYYDD